MRKFSTIQNASGWSAIYKQAVDLWGNARADEVFDRALELTGAYEKAYRGLKGIHKMHVMCAIAVGSLYLPLKEALGPETAARLLEEAQKPTAIAKHDRIEKYPARLFMKIVAVITSTMFGEKAGFRRRTLCSTAAERRFDLLTCPMWRC